MMWEQQTSSLEIAQNFGLSENEFSTIKLMLQRAPNNLEITICSAMWNEHCSYKSSRTHLKRLHVSGSQVIQGPGENAGVVDIGDGLACVFKMESHNHPSYIVPFHGAATGVGGILRDVFTMGAEPIAIVNSLFFGEVEHPKTKSLLKGVVHGISDYGNSFGVPNVTGSTMFDKSYNNNILVNAMAVGIAKQEKVFYSAAPKANLPVIYIGSATGTDGLGGSTMASQVFDDKTKTKRPTVQIGDPFMGQCLKNACLEIMQQDLVLSIQDMGAAGLTCSSVEIGSKGDLGIELWLDKVPVRGYKISPYEIMLSESQERMLLIAKPGATDEIHTVMEKWGIEYAEVGVTTSNKVLCIKYHDNVLGKLPIMELGSMAPKLNRPIANSTTPPTKHLIQAKKCIPKKETLLKLISSPRFCSKKEIYQQFDFIIQDNTVTLPPTRCAVVKVEDTNKALSITSAVTPHYCQSDPFNGAIQAVCETWRNLISAGSKPLAITDNLNFANPEKPEIMEQFSKVIDGMTKACKTLNFPVVSGNVSFYNECNDISIMPTPTVCGVGLINDTSTITSANWQTCKGHVILILGTTTNVTFNSQYGRIIEQIGDEWQNCLPPVVDLEQEMINGEFISTNIQNHKVSACYPLAEGGLGTGLALMSLYSGRGCYIKWKKMDTSTLYAEDQSRYIVVVSKKNAEEMLKNAKENGVSLEKIGIVAENKFEIEGAFSIELTELKEHYQSFMKEYMHEV